MVIGGGGGCWQEYLRNNRDYSCLFDGDEAAHEQSRRKSNLSSTGSRRGEESSKFSNDVKHERQEYLDRRQRLKELERQKLKGKLGSRPHNHHDGAQEETVHHSAQDREKRPQPHSKNRSFGSFFGPSEPIVAKRIIDEAAAREVTVMVAARAAKQAQVHVSVNSRCPAV
jgi:hypothetical protein